MRFFVYGKLKTGEPKGWAFNKYIAKSVNHRLIGYKICIVKKNKVAGLVKGSEIDFVLGELKEIKKWVPWLIQRLILFVLDLNEGHPVVYKREEVLLSDGKVAWVYFYMGQTKGAKEVHKWSTKQDVWN